MPVILGLNFHHADAAACLLVDGRLVGAVAEERLGDRLKHSPAFPENAIRWLLADNGVRLADVTHVALPRDASANRNAKLCYVLSHPVKGGRAAITHLVRSKKTQSMLRRLANLCEEDPATISFATVPVEHHLAHIASSYYCSPFDGITAGFSYDASGDFASAMAVRYETERAGCAWLPSARHKPYVIQPNGLDIDNLNRRLQSAPLAWAPFAVSGSKERKLVFLGRLNVIKGLELQLETLANLRTAGEAVSLHWIGPDDGEWPKLKALASRLGVSDALHWHGPVYGDERLALLRAADAVLLTSHYECNSYMAAETMSVGGALVATDTCHLDRAALAGAARVAPREPGQFSAALRDVLRDETAAAALRDAGIEFARTALNGGSLAAKMLAFYRDLLDESRTCAA